MTKLKDKQTEHHRISNHSLHNWHIAIICHTLRRYYSTERSHKTSRHRTKRTTLYVGQPALAVDSLFLYPTNHNERFTTLGGFGTWSTVVYMSSSLARRRSRVGCKSDEFSWTREGRSGTKLATALGLYTDSKVAVCRLAGMVYNLRLPVPIPAGDGKLIPHTHFRTRLSLSSTPTDAHSSVSLTCFVQDRIKPCSFRMSTDLVAGSHGLNMQRP